MTGTGLPLAAAVAEMAAPSVRYRFSDRQNSILKAGAEIHLEPRFQSSPAPPRAQTCNPLPDFAQREHAQEEDRFVRLLDPAENIVIGLGPDQFGDDVRIQQEAAHRSIGLPKSRGRSS